MFASVVVGRIQLTDQITARLAVGRPEVLCCPDPKRNSEVPFTFSVMPRVAPAFLPEVALDTLKFMKQSMVLFFVLVIGTHSNVARAQQPSGITLAKAVSIALGGNPAQKMAVAEHRAAVADVREAKAAFLPQVSFTESAMTGTDPVFAFGTRLRQGRFTNADFALNRLNYPDPISDFSAGVSGQWTLFDSFRNRFTEKRAQWMENAAKHDLDRAGQQIVYATVAAYYNVLLAEKQAQLAEETVHTAESVMEQSQSRVDAGTAVAADLLSAKVLLAQRRQEFIVARNDLAMAQMQFNIVLGLPADTPQEMSQILAEHALDAPPVAELESTALKNRPDLLGVTAMAAAQDAGVKLAKASFGPRLNAIGSWRTDTVNFAGNGSNSWMAGAELQFDIFSGGAKLARLQHERAMQDRAAAAKNGAEDNVRLELRRAYYDFDSARQSLEVTRATVSQAEEALRMLRDRYESGLATITDLLRTEDAVRQSRTAYWQAVSHYATSYAAMELAAGTLNPSSSVVTQ
jgi:outer membrane protein